MTLSPESEKQLHGLRLGLKLIACLISPLLTLQLYVAVANLFRAKEMVSELGASLPGLFQVLTAQPLLIHALPLFSFASFITILLLCLRNRGSVFLHVFAVSLFLHLLLSSFIEFTAELPLKQMYRMLML